MTGAVQLGVKRKQSLTFNARQIYGTETPCSATGPFVGSSSVV
jgi:hypothetical protein